MKSPPALSQNPVERVPAMSEDTRTCSFEGCDKPRYSRDYCTGHYRQSVGGKQLHPLRPYVRRAPECLADECSAKPHSHGYCRAHWNRLSRYGRLERVYARYETGETCTVSGCEHPVKAKGYCQLHYMRVIRSGDPGGPDLIAHPKRQSKYAGKTCAVDGCGKTPKARGWCQMHYHRWKRTGDAVGKWGAQPRQSQGYTTTDGYRMSPERRGGRPILEHRLVMEQVIGRPLYRHEEPHHKNGIRDDNSPGNLELWVKWRQPNGQRLSDLLAFIARYYPDEMRAVLEAQCE